MAKKKDDDLVKILNIVASMEPHFAAIHTAEQIGAIRRAIETFMLTGEEVALLARLFVKERGEDGLESWFSEMPSDRNVERLVRYGYAEKDSGGNLHITEAAKRAIEAGDPYIIGVDDDFENSEFFSRLATKVQEEFDGDDVTLPRSLWDELRNYPRASFVRRIHERFDDIPDGERELLLVLCSHFQTAGPIGWTFPENFNKNEKTKGQQILGRLTERGIAVTVASESDKGKNVPVILSPDAVGYLFNGLGGIVNLGGALASYGTLIKAENVRKRALFYNDDIAPDVNRLFKAFSLDTAKRIMDRLAARGNRRGMSCLIYGPPGTGKTELAMQLAAASGRAIVKADVAKLTGSYVGESERNYRGIFNAYRYAVILLDPAPILLLNEADTFIAPRVMVRQAIDKFENNVQNIMLEEMEMFEGLMVATTNNNATMDPAFDRRFFVKLEIGAPDAATRYRIWRDRMPELLPEMAERLADRFRLTGAGIENVVARFDLLEILDGKKPGYNDIAELCGQAEKQVVGGTRRAVGYKTDS